MQISNPDATPVADTPRPGRRVDRSRALRRLGAGGALAASAAVLATAAAGAALASNPAPATIKACYKPVAGPATLGRIASSASCPAGYSSLTWNKTGPPGPQGTPGMTGAQGPQGAQGPAGPQGPAGVSAGTSAFSFTQVPLDVPNSPTTVVQAPAVSQPGTYYVSGTVTIFVGQADYADCTVEVVGGGIGGASAIVGPAVSNGYQALAVTGTLLLGAGGAPSVVCMDFEGNTATYFVEGSLTATLIGSPIGQIPPDARQGRPAIAKLPPHQQAPTSR